MAEEFLVRARSRIEEAKKQLEEAEALISRLQRAGEDVSQLQQRANELKYKIQRYEEAFKK